MTDTDDRPGPGPHPRWPDPLDPQMPVREELEAILVSMKDAHEKGELMTNLALTAPAIRRARDRIERLERERDEARTEAEEWCGRAHPQGLRPELSWEVEQ